MNEQQRLAQESQERQLIEEEKLRFQEGIQEALGPFRRSGVRIDRFNAHIWHPIVRESIVGLFLHHYQEVVHLTFDETNPNVLTVRASNRPRKLRVAIDLKAQH